MADGMDTKLADEVAKRTGITTDWEAYCDSLPGCTDVKNEKGLGTKQSDGGENGSQNGGGNQDNCPPEGDGPGQQPTCD